MHHAKDAADANTPQIAVRGPVQSSAALQPASGLKTEPNGNAEDSKGKRGRRGFPRDRTLITHHSSHSRSPILRFVPLYRLNLCLRAPHTPTKYLNQKPTVFGPVE